MFGGNRGKDDEVRTKFIFSSKEAARLERRANGPKGFRIEVLVDFTKPAEPLNSGYEMIDRILSGIDGFMVTVRMDEGEAGTEKALAIKNAGFALGECIRKLVKTRKAKGTGSSIHSGGKSMCMIAIRTGAEAGEANMQIIGSPKGFDTEHFFAFFDGLSQGLEAEVIAAVDFGEGKTPAKGSNVKFELVSKAFSDCLKQVFG
jgi:hypothetical protein